MTWRWDKKRRLYLDNRGVKLTQREIREALDEYIDSIQRGITSQVARYTAGQLSISELFGFLNEEVTALHGASGSIAYGGLEQMSIREWGRVERNLISELGYLEQFKLDVRAAERTAEALSTEGIANRAGLYAEAVYSEYMNQTVERESDAGIETGRRVCAADDASCEECKDAATEKFIPLDEIEDIGSLQCGNNCRCEIEFGDETESFKLSELFALTGVIGGQEAYGGSVLIGGPRDDN